MSGATRGRTTTLTTTWPPTGQTRTCTGRRRQSRKRAGTNTGPAAGVGPGCGGLGPRLGRRGLALGAEDKGGSGVEPTRLRALGSGAAPHPLPAADLVGRHQELPRPRPRSFAEYVQDERFVGGV